jgi:hypothetical protein
MPLKAWVLAFQVLAG